MRSPGPRQWRLQQTRSSTTVETIPHEPFMKLLLSRRTAACLTSWYSEEQAPERDRTGCSRYRCIRGSRFRAFQALRYVTVKGLVKAPGSSTVTSRRNVVKLKMRIAPPDEASRYGACRRVQPEPVVQADCVDDECVALPSTDRVSAYQVGLGSSGCLRPSRKICLYVCALPSCSMKMCGVRRGMLDQTPRESSRDSQRPSRACS